MFRKIAINGVLAVAVIIAVSSNSLCWARDKSDHLPSYVFKAIVAANMEDIGVLSSVTALAPDKQAAVLSAIKKEVKKIHPNTTISESNIRVISASALRQDNEIVIEEYGCLGGCLESAGVSWVQVLICIGVCILGVVPACSVCLGVDGGTVVTCFALCLIY